MKVYFVRHGQSEANLHKFFAGQADAKLTGEGRAQAEAIRPVLKDIPFDKVYSSDLSRAHDTQKLALPGYEAELLPLLREVNVGNLVGKSVEEFKAKHGGESPTKKSGDYTPYGGEDRAMVDARVRQFMDMLETQPYETVAVFAHWGILMGVLRNILGPNELLNSAVKCDNCAINVVEFDGEKWSICSLNYMRKV